MPEKPTDTFNERRAEQLTQDLLAAYRQLRSGEYFRQVSLYGDGETARNKANENILQAIVILTEKVRGNESPEPQAFAQDAVLKSLSPSQIATFTREIRGYLEDILDETRSTENIAKDFLHELIALDRGPEYKVDATVIEKAFKGTETPETLIEHALEIDFHNAVDALTNVLVRELLRRDNTLDKGKLFAEIFEKLQSTAFTGFRNNDATGRSVRTNLLGPYFRDNLPAAIEHIERRIIRFNEEFKETGIPQAARESIERIVEILYKVWQYELFLPQTEEESEHLLERRRTAGVHMLGTSILEELHDENLNENEMAFRNFLQALLTLYLASDEDGRRVRASLCEQAPNMLSLKVSFEELIIREGKKAGYDLERARLAISPYTDRIALTVWGVWKFESTHPTE